MNALTPWQRIALIACLGFGFYEVCSHLEHFSSISFLAALLLLEVIVASLWKYKERFFLLLMIAFLWAGMHVPLQAAWTSGRWFVLTAGTLTGWIVWIDSPQRTFRKVHLIAFFCAAAALVSATVSPFPQMALYKAVSLFLLFLYCVSGARLAVLGREQRFFRGLLLAGEIAVYITAICYFALHETIWGNPNSLGVAMSVGVFPLLLWGWFVSDGPLLKFRRLIALLVCVSLVAFSMARAGIISIVLVTLVFCLGLRQYKLLARIVALVLALVAVTGMFAPDTLHTSFLNLKDAALYKGHKEEGMLGSRRTPWEKSIETMKEHPWFGTGYGTSPTGEDPGFAFGKYASTAETAREHGSSYITILEWVGLLGVMPFTALLLYTACNAARVVAWMHRTSEARHYAVPMAMIVLAGMMHASFEDWLFAVGAYPCVYFWVFAFLLADLQPPEVSRPSFAALPRSFVPRQDLGMVPLSR